MTVPEFDQLVSDVFALREQIDQVEEQKKELEKKSSIQTFLNLLNTYDEFYSNH